MKKGLRQEIYKKRTLHNKFLKQKTNKNWEAYTKQRNFVNKLKKKNLFRNIFMKDVQVDQSQVTSGQL